MSVPTPSAGRPRDRTVYGYVLPPAAMPVYGPPRTWPDDTGTVVSQYAIEVGRLPRICVLSGEPTQNMVRVQWHWGPWWALLVSRRHLPAGLLRRGRPDRVAGYLPIAPGMRRRYQLRLALGLAAFTVGVLTMVAGAAAGQAFVAVAGVLLLVGSIGGLARHGQLVNASRADVGYVALRNAHPEFDRAVRAGRTEDQPPYTRRAPNRAVRRSSVGAGLVVAFALLGGALRLFGLDNNPGCGCRVAAAPGQAGVTYTQRQQDVCMAAFVEVLPVEDAITKRGALVGDLGSVPASATAIAAVRKEDASLATTVGALTTLTADPAVQGQYVAALAAYDASLGTSGAQEAARLVQTQEQALEAGFSSVVSGCPVP